MMRGMRIGINGSADIAIGAPISQMIDHAAEAEAAGFASYWVAQLAVPDALTVIAMMGERTSTIEIGTAVISTWPRHPLMLAAQALTTQEAIGNRLALGIGLAHKTTVESTLRIPFATPAKHMDEYLSVLLPALTDRKVSFKGDVWSGEVEALSGVPGARPPAVLLAAMGPRMLRLAGGRTDGSILWLAGPRAIEKQIKPALDAAAAEAGRTTPRIVASVPVCVTSNGAEVRATIAALLEGYNDLPSYRGVMDTEGVAGPADVSLVGDEGEVRAGLAAFADAGATDFAALEFATNPDDTAATRALLTELARA
jgi:5,10-methylenetetrahydromethanopterin reductase